MAAQSLPLKDIKPIVDVPDHSLWLLVALVTAALLLIAALAFWALRLRRGRIDRKRMEALRRLDALDYGDTKAAVYDFSLLGHFVVTPATEGAFASLLDDLEPYKFRATVPALDEALKQRLQAFVKEAHRG